MPRKKIDSVDVCDVVPNWSLKRVAKSKLNLPCKVHFVSYGDPKYEKTLFRLWLQAHDTHWFDSVTAFRRNMLSYPFQQEFHHILSLPRGGGYWIWKADILLQAIDNSSPNDIIVYVDSGCTINTKAETRFVEYIHQLHSSQHSSLSFQLLNDTDEKYTVS